MGRNWSTITLIAGAVLLLVLLGALQYRWQSQIAENDGEKLRRTVREDAARFAADFNREIQGAYFNFQVEADEWRNKNYAAFAERYEFWRGKTKYPDLIAAFYFFEAAADAAPLKYDPPSRSFVAAEWTDELRSLRSRFADEKDLQPVYADINTLVLPVVEVPKEWKAVVLRRSPGPPDGKLEQLKKVHRPVKYGFLAIRLDRRVLTDEILAGLSTQYFGDGQYVVTVAPKEGETVFQTGKLSGAADAEAPLFSVAPADLIYFANKDVLSSFNEERQGGMVVNQRFESRMTHVATTGDGATMKIEVERGPNSRASIVTATAGGGGSEPWLLSVQHAAGSIDNHLAANKRRSLAMGFGILALLGAAFGAIIYSAHRAKMFAARQVEFVSSVSHEFRTPLAVLYSAGENLADGVANDEAQVEKYGELIKGEGRKLSAMVEQILEFAGANSGRQKYNRRETDVGDVVRQAVGECRSLLDEHGFRIESNIDRDLPLISADREALSRAIQNLIVNAVKYADGDRWIGINARNGGRAVKVSVEDRGMGIAKGELTKIFEPFYRSRKVVNAQIHGNGLGLALVKQIAEAHGGRVTVRSEAGKGSVFTIELPADQD